MRKEYEINEAKAQEIREARRVNKDKRIELRLHALELRAAGLKNPEIAKRLEVSPKVVSRWVSRNCNKGLASIIKIEYGGHHRNLSYEEEEAFLGKYEEEANRGQDRLIYGQRELA